MTLKAIVSFKDYSCDIDKNVINFVRMCLWCSHSILLWQSCFGDGMAWQWHRTCAGGLGARTRVALRYSTGEILVFSDAVTPSLRPLLLNEFIGTSICAICSIASTAFRWPYCDCMHNALICLYTMLYWTDFTDCPLITILRILSK